MTNAMKTESAARWHVSKKQEHSCNAHPRVWAAIYGCTGRGSNWRYETGSFGRRDVLWACDTCRAAAIETDALRGPAYQTFLGEAQAKAGVINYRNAGVAIVNGRPVITSAGNR